MHYGQMLQSNAVHFFHLASPDLLFGFEGPIEKRNFVGTIEEYPEVAKWAIFVRKVRTGSHQSRRRQEDSSQPRFPAA
jgi:NAD-reducing hydrogenase large subunit